MSYQDFKKWLDEDEDEEEEQQSQQVSSSGGFESFKRFIENREEVPEQQPVQQEQVQPQQEEKKNVFQKVGGAIKEAVLGKDIEGDKRTTWERIQEEFLGIETKGGKKNREEVKQYYENLRTGKEKADTAQELQDLAKIKAYEKLRDEADVMSAEKKEGQAKDYIEIENYDNNDPEIKAYTKKHPFTTVGQIMEKFPDKTIKKYYEQDVTTGKRREISKEEYEKGKSKSVDYKRLQDIYAGIRILESELGIRYESKGIIPEQIKNLDAGIAMGMVGYQQWTPVISTEALEEGSKALKKASEEGWDSLSEREQTEAMVYYASSVEENNKAEMSLMDKILTIPAQSLGWGFGMTGSTLLTGTASIPDPATLSTGLVKVVQTAGVEAVKAIGLSSILDDNTNKKYLELTTPEYAYFVDKTGDIIIEKLQEAKYSEQEESLGVISKDNKARQMAELSNFLEIFSESWGKVLGVAGEEFLNSLIKTKVFTSFANWARKTGKLLDGSVNQLLKTGRFDSILGEFLEEELLEPIQSRIEKRDYQGINTKEGRERMLIEILGFGMTGAGAMIQGYVQNKNKKKAIDFINNNKEKFGIEEGKELDTQGNLYDKATGEIIVPKEEVFKEPVKDDVFVETMVDKTDAFKELEEDIKRAEEELKKEEVRVESEQEIKVEADITEKISEDIPEQMQQEAEKDWIDNYAEQYQELDDRVRELEERMKTAKKAEIPALQEERDKLNNEMENISDTFVQKYQVKQPKKVSEATRKEKENVEKAQEITIGNETFIVPETNRNTLAEDLTLDLQKRLDTLETDPIKLVREQTKTGDFAELYAEGKTDKELLSIPRIKKWIAREKEDLKKGLESGKKRLQENGYILKETKPKTQKEVVKEKEQKQKKEIKKVEPKKAEEEVTKEPTKPKTEKAVKEAPKREKVESLVKTEESQKEFENKMEMLDQKAQEQYGKKFDELNPKRQVEILRELERGENYLRTSDEEILTRLGRGLGTLSLSDLGEMRNDVETLLWGEGRDGMYTDGKILITDKTVGNKIVEKFREQYIKQYIKKYVTAKKKMSVQEAEIARQRAEKEIAENIKDNNFPETKEILQEAQPNFKLEPIGFYVDSSYMKSGSVIFRAENGILVRLQGIYYSAIKSFYPNAEFYITGNRPEEAISIMVGKTRKGLVMPMVLSRDVTLENLVGEKLLEESRRAMMSLEEKAKQDRLLERSKEFTKEGMMDEMVNIIGSYIDEEIPMEEIPSIDDRPIGYRGEGSWKYNKETGVITVNMIDGREITFSIKEVYDYVQGYLSRKRKERELEEDIKRAEEELKKEGQFALKVNKVKENAPTYIKDLGVSDEAVNIAFDIRDGARIDMKEIPEELRKEVKSVIKAIDSEINRMIAEDEALQSAMEGGFTREELAGSLARDVLEGWGDYTDAFKELKEIPFREGQGQRQVLNSDKLNNADLEELKRINRQIFGDENLEIIERIMTPQAQVAMGRYLNKWIQIRAGSVNKGSTYFHEAVHKALDIFLTPNEKKLLIKEVRRVKGNDYLRREFGKLTTKEKLRVESNLGWAESVVQKYISMPEKVGYGVEGIVKADSSLKGKEQILMALADRVGISPDSLSGVVLEEKVDNKTKYHLIKEEDISVMYALVQDDQLRDEKSQNYRLIDISEIVNNENFAVLDIAGKPFNPQAFPYSAEKNRRETQKTFRRWVNSNYRDIARNLAVEFSTGMGKYRGATETDLDAMAEEWLAENIIDHINTNTPTTFVGKLKRMVELFIDRWFKTMDNIESITDFYDALLSGRLLERQRRLDRQQVKAFNKYLRSVSGSGVRTDALYRAEVAKEVDKLTTKILKKLEGKIGTVKKQYISDLAKQQDIKKVEKDIINQVLKKFPDDVDIATFKEKVLAELLPLERAKLYTPRYEFVALPYDMRGEIDDYYEVIYRSPFEVEAGDKHYSYELDDYFDSVIDEDTLRREAKISEKYFGHIRAEGIGKDLRRIIEVQSDLYQKGTLKEEKERVSEYRTSTKQLTLLKGLEQLSTQYNDPTAHFRMVREEIRQASIDNIKTLLFPTGQTAMIIEGHVDRKQWFSNFSEFISNREVLKQEDIKVGEKIYDASQQTWVITKDLGDGRFKAIPYRELEMGNIEELYNYAMNNGIIDKETEEWNLNRAFKDKYLLEEIERRRLSEQFDISNRADPTNPIYRFYEETLGKYLKNQYGAERYIDERGVSWWKISIKPEYAGAVEAFRTDELVDYEKIAKQYKEEDAFVAEMLSRNPDYAMTHRPTYFVDEIGDFTQVMPSASNLLEGDILPKDVYEHPEWSISPQHNDITNQESWKALLSVRGKPEADLKVYRASSRDELNIGDWITLSKSYAESHAESNGLRVHEFTIKAKEAVFAGDDINEFGYYPEDKLREIWRKAQENVAKYRVEEPAEVAVPLPELLEIATDLGTDVSLSRRMKRNLGLFKSPKGLAQSVDETAIKLNALLFEPQGDVVINQKGEEERLPETPEQQMDRIHAIERVLAHEIGHFWDWFGGEKNLTLGRGNILGRIGNLVNYLGQHLMSPDQQGKYEALKKEAFELRMDRRNLKDSSGKITNKARYNALGRKLRVVNKQVRALEENALAKHPEVLAELKTLTQIWRPFDENANERYTKYRYSSKELYADAVSVLLNNPKLLKQTAPKFYQGFVQFLARKKEVKAEFFAIVDSIKEGSNIQARIDRKDEGYKKATGIRMSIDQRKEEMRKQRKWENVMSKIKYSIADQHAPYLDKMRKLYKEGGIELSKLQESEMLMDEMDFIGDKQGMYVKEVQKNFFDPLNEAGIDADDVGKIMELERNLGDRIDLANPQGLEYDYARETYNKLKEKFTPAQWAVLQDRVNWFREFNFDLVTRGYEAGVYSEKFYNQTAQVNKNTYTPFAVIEYITDNYVKAGIIPARGTTKQVENPINTQMLKSLDLIRLTTINLAKTDIIKTLQENFPNEIKEAEAIRGADGYIRAFKRDAELEDRGYKQLELLIDGKRTAFYVDGYIKESFDKLLDMSTSQAVKMFFAPVRAFNRIFKPAVTTFKPSFQFYSNPIKDIKDSLNNLSALSAYFDQDNRGVALRTGRVYKAFMKEWMASLKQSWDYAGNKMDKVTDKMLRVHAISGNIKYEDIDLGTDEISFDAVKNRVVHKGKVNWADSAIEWMGSKAILKQTIYPLLKVYQRLGQTLEVNSKVAGFQYFTKEIGLDERTAGYYTRKYVGTPNFMQKGKFTNITNEIQPFSNVAMQGFSRSIELAGSPKTASGYWFSMFFSTIVPKLVMLAGATLLKIPIPDPDDEDKTIWVNPFDYMSEYDKSNYITIPIGYDITTKKFLYLRIPMSETEQVVGNAVWKMGRVLQGEGIKVEQLAVSVIGMIPFAGLVFGDGNPFTEIVGGWADYVQGRNPYDDFRGRPAIATSKWEEGGMTRFAEMLKWSTNTIGLTNFVTYDKDLDTTLEHVLQAPILERMFRLSDYGLTEKEEWEKAMGKREKNKQLDTILQKYYSEPSDKNLLKYQQEYVKAVKGEPPAEGWSGDDKAEETRLKTEFKREVLAQSGSEFSKIAKSGLDNDEKEAILDSKRKQLSEDEFTDFIAQTVRYEVVKGEMFAEYAKKAKLTDEQVYKVVKKSIPVLSAESNNTLLWELRKIDMISDRSLAQLRSDGLLTSAGYAKYKQVTSRWYEDRYLRNKEKEQEDTRNKLFY